MTSVTDRYLVVGNPIEHSRSPQIHRLFAEQLGDSLQYDKALVPLGGFAEFAQQFAQGGGLGMNVTVPFKLDAFAFVDAKDHSAQTAQAVNTIAFTEAGSCGYNTDGIGLLEDLKHRHKQTLHGKRILLLGAGGAARGVLEPLLNEEPEQLIIANRTPSKAQQLIDAFAAQAPRTRLAAQRFSDLASGAELVINATSVGLNAEFELLESDVVKAAFCYDMSYGKAAQFHRWAHRCGARGSVDGLGMLVEQAAESFLIWRGRRPATEPVYLELREAVDALSR